MLLARFPSALIAGTLIKRYKRFLADVALDSGETVTAHCCNPGSMLGLSAPGSRVWLSHAQNPKRKLRYSWELIEVDLGRGRALVGINTTHPNTAAASAISAGLVPELAGYATLKREVGYANGSRIDILLDGPGKPPCYVEVKNVHLMRTPGRAEFPDSVTARGAKHLAALSQVAASGARAVMLFLVQRGDAETFSLARDIDEAYGQAFDAAMKAGVETLALACELTLEGIARPCPIPLLD